MCEGTSEIAAVLRLNQAATLSFNSCVSCSLAI